MTRKSGVVLLIALLSGCGSLTVDYENALVEVRAAPVTEAVRQKVLAVATLVLEDAHYLTETVLVDSLGVLRIMAFLDEEFDVDLGYGEIHLENFKDLKTICAVVQEQGGA